MSHKEAARGPSSAIWAPVFPANDPNKVVGISGSLTVWEQLLENAFANQVSGIDCVLKSTQREAFAYAIEHGKTTVKGDGSVQSVQERESMHRRLYHGWGCWHEISASLGYSSADALQNELEHDDSPQPNHDDNSKQATSIGTPFQRHTTTTPMSSSSKPQPEK
ncbi:expressed unknown protein [Seminavis robusta]|uniref:Uncharacterized protein n=1 Tax=Seminavis robusta TaxID=568900 RepID=A0A9N8DDE3_9STRA|nr:expressed unknown protein [Seminavis robusta]|eukprot:Sro96_g049510.1 n/a (164) ;mRNA; f:34439-35264